MFRFLITLSITSLVAGIVFFPLVHYLARDTKDPDAYDFVAFFVSNLLIVFAAIAVPSRWFGGCGQGKTGICKAFSTNKWTFCLCVSPA